MNWKRARSQHEEETYQSFNDTFKKRKKKVTLGHFVEQIRLKVAYQREPLKYISSEYGSPIYN